jgi:DNA-binding CsgD family transcriptional regulator
MRRSIVSKPTRRSGSYPCHNRRSKTKVSPCRRLSALPAVELVDTRMTLSTLCPRGYQWPPADEVLNAADDVGVGALAVFIGRVTAAGQERERHCFRDVGKVYGVDIVAADQAYRPLDHIVAVSAFELIWERTADEQEDQLQLHLITLFAQARVSHLHGAPVKTPNLTLKELEVLKWCHAGKTSSEIGQIMTISDRTVNFHVQNICRKPDVVSRQAAIAKSIHAGLIL